MVVKKAPSVASKTTGKPMTKPSSKAPTVVSNNERAGLSLTKSGVNNPNPIQHGGMGQAERAFSAASTLASGIMAISASQFIGAPLKLVDPTFYDHYMAWTKESFAVLVTAITQWWAPTVVRVSGDDSMKGQLFQMEDGSLRCNFPHRMVLMANHQLYTDWLYLWWIAYTNKMHGRIYIILKESLKKLPILGWGAQFYNFIFLSRKWETDQYRFRDALSHLKNPKDPMWLMIFPEGTNLSAVTREKSKAWAKKTGTTDMKHQLLPRTTGLQFCLKELKTTTNWLYDCTIAYEGVPEGMYGQDIFTLKSSFFEGRPPKSVNLYWRRFKIADIPVDNDEAFGRWLMNRWREKDYFLEYFYKFNHFPADDATKALAAANGKGKPNHAKMIATEVRGGGWDEFLGIFGPLTTAAGAMGNIDLTEPMNLEALMATVAKSQQLNLMNIGNTPMGAASQDAVRKALRAAQKSKALPPAVMEYLMQYPPQTQEQMKAAIVTSAKKSGNVELAKKVSKAPAENKTLPLPTDQNVNDTAAKNTKKWVMQTAAPRRNNIPSPAPRIKEAMPMANMNSVVTRPLTTMAVQTAAATVRNTATQQIKQAGTAPPAQTADAKKTVNTSKPSSVAPAPASKKVASKVGTTNTARRPSVVSLPAGKRPPTAQKPLGSQKRTTSVKG